MGGPLPYVRGAELPCRDRRGVAGWSSRTGRVRQPSRCACRYRFDLDQVQRRPTAPAARGRQRGRSCLGAGSSRARSSAGGEPASAVEQPRAPARGWRGACRGRRRPSSTRSRQELFVQLQPAASGSVSRSGLEGADGDLLRYVASTRSIDAACSTRPTLSSWTPSRPLTSTRSWPARVGRPGPRRRRGGVFAVTRTSRCSSSATSTKAGTLLDRDPRAPGR